MDVYIVQSPMLAIYGRLNMVCSIYVCNVFLYRVAQMVEDVVRSNGTVPASIGLIDGQIHVGLTPLQLSHLARPGMSKLKISRRDFPYALSKVSYLCASVYCICV